MSELAKAGVGTNTSAKTIVKIATAYHGVTFDPGSKDYFIRCLNNSDSEYETFALVKGTWFVTKQTKSGTDYANATYSGGIITLHSGWCPATIILTELY